MSGGDWAKPAAEEARILPALLGGLCRQGWSKSWISARDEESGRDAASAPGLHYLCIR